MGRIHPLRPFARASGRSRALDPRRAQPHARTMRRTPRSRTPERNRAPAPRPRRLRAWAVGVATAAIVALLAAWNLARHRAAPTAPQAARGEQATLSTLDLPAANRLAVGHAQAKRFIQSLPYFRREFELLDHQVWGLHY